MLIDIIVAILLVMAAIKGFRKGLIIGVFSYLAFAVGLAAAMKLSATVASRLGGVVTVSEKWMPFLSFILVLVVVIFLVRWLAGMLQKLTETLMMGWLNRIGGVALFAILYISVFAIFLFYLIKMNLVTDESASNSVTYGYIRPLGRFAVDAVGKIVPAFKGMFAELGNFFETIADKTAK